jgi:hypothetical protein
VRANRVCRTDRKHPYGKPGFCLRRNRLEGFYSRFLIACGWYLSARDQESARTGRRPRNALHLRWDQGAGVLARCRAPTAFSARIKDIRTENAVLINGRNTLRGFIRDP